MGSYDLLCSLNTSRQESLEKFKGGGGGEKIQETKMGTEAPQRVT